MSRSPNINKLSTFVFYLSAFNQSSINDFLTSRRSDCLTLYYNSVISGKITIMHILILSKNK